MPVFIDGTLITDSGLIRDGMVVDQTSPAGGPETLLSQGQHS